MENDIIGLYEKEIEDTQQVSEAKELFDFKEPKAKTELTLNEIKNIVKIKLLNELLNDEETDLNDITNEYMVLKISHKRQSRQEFVKSYTSQIDELKQELSAKLTR